MQITRRHKKNGFTLVELVLVIALMGILAFALAPALITGVRSYDIVWSRRQVLAEGRVAMDRMVKEIRLIESSSDVIATNSPAEFDFEYPNGTSIAYSLDGTDLKRNTDVLASDVTALEFKYFDSTGSETSTEADVRRVQVTLTIDAPGNHGDLTLRTNVFLRNTGNSYESFSIQ